MDWITPPGTYKDSPTDTKEVGTVPLKVIVAVAATLTWYSIGWTKSNGDTVSISPLAYPLPPLDTPTVSTAPTLSTRKEKGVLGDPYVGEKFKTADPLVSGFPDNVIVVPDFSKTVILPPRPPIKTPDPETCVTIYPVWIESAWDCVTVISELPSSKVHDTPRTSPGKVNVSFTRYPVPFSENWNDESSIVPGLLVIVKLNPPPDPPRSALLAERISPFWYPIPESEIVTPVTSPAFTLQPNVAPDPFPPVNGTSL